MGRVAWVKWRMRYGDPNSRKSEMRFFVSFELYNLICILSRYKVRHWLKPKPVGPAGKYLRVVRPAPGVVRFLDRKFSFGEESHCDYFPYSSEVEADLRRVGKSVTIVEVSYQLRAAVY